MAGYYLFGRTTSSLVSRKDVPKILIVITDGRWVSYIVVTVSVFRCLITRIAFTCMRIICCIYSVALIGLHIKKYLHLQLDTELIRRAEDKLLEGR